MLHLIGTRSERFNETCFIEAQTQSPNSRAHISCIDEVLEKICAQHLPASGYSSLILVSRRFNQLVQQRLNEQTSLTIGSETNIDSLLTFPKLAHLKVRKALSNSQIDQLINFLAKYNKLNSFEIVDHRDPVNSMRLFIRILSSSLDLKIIRCLDFSVFYQTFFFFEAREEWHQAFSLFNNELSSALRQNRLSGIQCLRFKGQGARYTEILIKNFLEYFPSNLIELDISSKILEISVVNGISELIKSDKFSELKSLKVLNKYTASAFTQSVPLDAIVAELAKNPPQNLEKLHFSGIFFEKNVTVELLLEAFKQNKFGNLKDVKFFNYVEFRNLTTQRENALNQKENLIKCLFYCKNLEKINIFNIKFSENSFNSIRNVLLNNENLMDFEIEAYDWEQVEVSALLSELATVGNANLERIVFINRQGFSQASLNILAKALRKSRFPKLAQITLSANSSLEGIVAVQKSLRFLASKNKNLAHVVHVRQFSGQRRVFDLMITNKQEMH